MSTEMILQNNVKIRREMLGLSQRELAQRIGVSQAMLNQIENFGRNVPIGRIPLLAKALGCTIDDLFTERKQEG